MRRERWGWSEYVGLLVILAAVGCWLRQEWLDLLAHGYVRNRSGSTSFWPGFFHLSVLSGILVVLAGWAGFQFFSVRAARDRKGRSGRRRRHRRR